MAAGATVPSPDLGKLWQDSFELLYQATFQQFASIRLSGRWHSIDTLTAFFVTGTASGSAIAGWALWSSPGGKLAWVGIAGLASLLSLTHAVLQVPSKIKLQDDLKGLFGDLRLDVQTFRQNLRNGTPPSTALDSYNMLRSRYKEAMKNAPASITFTTRLRQNIQTAVNHELDSEIAKENPK